MILASSCGLQLRHNDALYEASWDATCVRWTSAPLRFGFVKNDSNFFFGGHSCSLFCQSVQSGVRQKHDDRGVPVSSHGGTSHRRSRAGRHGWQVPLFPQLKIHRLHAESRLDLLEKKKIQSFFAGSAAASWCCSAISFFSWRASAPHSLPTCTFISFSSSFADSPCRDSLATDSWLVSNTTQHTHNAEQIYLTLDLIWVSSQDLKGTGSL